MSVVNLPDDGIASRVLAVFCSGVLLVVHQLHRVAARVSLWREGQRFTDVAIPEGLEQKHFDFADEESE